LTLAVNGKTGGKAGTDGAGVSLIKVQQLSKYNKAVAMWDNVENYTLSISCILITRLQANLILTKLSKLRLGWVKLR